MFRKTLTLLCFCLVLVGCSAKEHELLLAGSTMGTSWSVKVISEEQTALLVEDDLQTILGRIESSMSNWIESSDVARFNRIGVGCLLIQPETQNVVSAALKVSGQSLGYFDPTVSPLIELWGFGTVDNSPAEPEPKAIRQALSDSGYQSISVVDQQLCKTNGKLQLNLSAIAKGYAVDLLAQELEASGYKRFLVEVGGELFGHGTNRQGEAWKIGVEKPGYDNLPEVLTVLPLDNRGVATSGDYRNYYELDGARYSHIIDPTTGYPVTHRAASVTVLHERVMYADAWATALLAAGPEKGLEIANDEGIAMLMVVRTDTGYKAVTSNGWPITVGF